MAALEAGDKSKDTIHEEFQLAFPDSAGKSTFHVFFSDVVRPFGSASASRDIRIVLDSNGYLALDSNQTARVKDAIAHGLLKELNALERGVYPKRNRVPIRELLDQFRIASTD